MGGGQQQAAVEAMADIAHDFRDNTVECSSFKSKSGKNAWGTATSVHTCCAWAGGTNANYPDFCKNHQFHVIYCVTLAYVLYFEEFLTLDSRQLPIFKE
jgi:hypothetical protein